MDEGLVKTNSKEKRAGFKILPLSLSLSWPESTGHFVPMLLSYCIFPVTYTTGKRLLQLRHIVWHGVCQVHCSPAKQDGTFLGTFTFKVHTYHNPVQAHHQARARACARTIAAGTMAAPRLARLSPRIGFSEESSVWLRDPSRVPSP